MANNKVNFEIGFTTNSKGLQDLKRQLNEIRSLANNIEFASQMDPSQIKSMVKAANDLEFAMNSAFDVNLNTVNIQKFNNILKQSGTNLTQIKQGLATAGAEGQSAFLKATAGLMQFNTAAKQTNQFLDKIATSFANTIRWTAMSTIVNNIMGTIQKSYYYVKDLDSALNDIRIVTGKNADEMSRFAEEANNAAKQLAVTTEDYTQGSLIYYQQGLDDKTVKALTDITAKTSNVTGQSMSAVSEELTAVWNGYKVANEAAQEGMQVYEEYVDKMAAVGASTASDLQELSTAMSKVASAASAMGVNFDDLNAQIATIVSVTRQAPESVGTALKTIYARLGDLKVDGVDEFGTKLGEVTSQLQTMGVQILDQNGDMRDMSSVMAEVAQKWDTWTSAQKQAAAVAMAGKRQYNNLVALFDNWDMYGDALKTSMEAAGTLEEQQEIALDSLANKMDILKATAEDLYDSLYDEEDIKDLIEGATKAVQVLADFSDAIGGLENLLPMLGATALRVFDNQISKGLSSVIINTRNAIDSNKMLEQNYNELASMFSSSTLFQGQDLSTLEGSARELFNYYNEMQQYVGIMSEEQKQSYNNILNNKEAVSSLKLEIEETTKAWELSRDPLGFIEKSLVEDINNVSKLSEQVATLTQISNEFRGFTVTEVFDTNNAQVVIDKLKESVSGIGDKLENNLRERLQAVYEKTGNWDEALKIVIEDLDKVGKEGNNLVKIEQKTKMLEASTKAAGDALKENLDLEKYIANITNAVGAMGQLAMSINTIKNLGSIWNNDDIETGEKILQTVMNLSFVLPSLLSSIQKINSLLGINASIIRVLNTQSTARQAIRNAELVLDKKINKEKIEEQIINKILARGTSDLTIKEEEEILAKGNNIIALNAETKAKIINTGATEAEKEAIKQATIAQNTFNASILANPILLVLVAAIGAATAAFIIHNAQVEKNIQLQEKEAKAAQEAADALKQEADAHDQIYQSYLSIKEQYEEGTASKEDLRDITNDLIEAYGLEEYSLEALAGKYDLVAEAAKKAREEERLELLQSQEKALKEEQEAIIAEGNKSFDRIKNKDGQTILDITSIEGTSTSLQETADASYVTGYEELVESVFGNKSSQISFDSNNINELIDNYTKIQELQEKLKGTKYEGEVERLQKILDTLNKDGKVEELIANQETYLKTLLSGDALNDSETQEEFDKNLQALKTKIQDAVDKGFLNLSEEDIDKSLLDFTRTLTSSFARNFNLEESIKQKYKNANQEIINEFLKLDKEFQDYLIELNFDFEQDPEKAKELINYYQTYFDNNADKTIAIPVSFQRQINDDILKGKDISKNDWESMQQYAPNMEEILGDRNSFNNKSIGERLELMNRLTESIREQNKAILENSEDYEKAGTAIKEELDKQIDKLRESIKQYQKYLEVLKQKNPDSPTIEYYQKKINELNDQIAELEDRQIEIEIDITSNPTEQVYNALQGIIGDLITDTDQLISATEAIGEGWRVAAEDVAQFAAAFPELMDQAELMTDGSIKLDKELTNQYLEDRQDMIEADAEVTIKAIDNKIAQVQAEIAYREKRIEILKSLLQGDIDEQEAEKQIADATINYKGELEKIGVQNNAEATNAMIQNSVTGAEGIIKSLDQANQALVTLNDNYKKMFTDEALDKIKGGVSAGTKASGDIKVSDATALRLGGRDEVAKIQKELEAEEKAVSGLKDELSSLWGWRSQVQAGANKSGHAVDRVSRGLPGKDEKSSSSKNKSKDKEEYTPDLYYEIEKAINSVDRAVKQLDKDQEKLYGKAKIKSLKEENKLIKEQVANYKAKYEIQKKEAAELRGKLSAGGVTFSDTGEITNYNEALAAATERYNQVVDQYNAGLASDEAIEQAKKNLDEFKKYVDRYDKLFYTEMKDLLEKIKDEIRKELANNLEAWQIKLDLKLEKNKMKREWNSFINEMTKDFKKVYRNIDKELSNLIINSKTYTKKKTGDIAVDIKALKEVEKEIDKIEQGKHSDKYENISQAQEKLKELNQQLLDHAEELYDLYEEAWKTYLDGIDQAKSKFEDINNVLEVSIDNLETQNQLIELMYGSKSYDMLKKANDASLKMAQTQLQISKQEEDTWADVLETMGYAKDSLASLDTSKLDEDTKKMWENWASAHAKVNENMVNAIQAAQEKLNTTMNEIWDNLEKRMTNGLGFDELDEQWESVEGYYNNYYDKIEQGYEVQKMTNQLAEDSQGKSLKAQQKLKKFQDTEIKTLREKDQLTKYDLKAAQARYDITLKEIALQEAQNNKTSMKLSRNAEGNWTYQYVADEDDVAKKQQDLLNAQMNARQLAKEESIRLQKKDLSERKKYFEKLQKLEDKYTSDYGDKDKWDADILEEYNKKREKLEEDFIAKRKSINDQYSIAYRDLMVGDYAVQQNIWWQSEEAYNQMTERERELFIKTKDATILDYEELRRQVDQNYQGIQDDLAERTPEIERIWHEAAVQQQITSEELRDAVLDAYSKINSANEEYQGSLETTGEIARQVLVGEGTSDGIIKEWSQIVSNEEAAKTKAKNYANEIKSDIPNAKDRVEELATAWGKVVSQLKKAKTALDKYLKKANKTNTALEDTNVDTDSTSTSSSSDNNDSSGSSGPRYPSGGNKNPGKTTITKVPTSPVAKTFNWGTIYGNGGAHYEPYVVFTDGSIYKATKKYNKSSDFPWMFQDETRWKGRPLKDIKASGLKTGGYTGSWGNEGKMAILHEKELVLNKEDTENFLEGINVLRDLSALDSSIKQAVASSIANLAIGLNSNGFENRTSTTQNQDINNVYNINANFPNANNVNDIKEAILSLPNLASQYVHERRY